MERSLSGVEEDRRHNLPGQEIRKTEIGSVSHRPTRAIPRQKYTVLVPERNFKVAVDRAIAKSKATAMFVVYSCCYVCNLRYRNKLGNSDVKPNILYFITFILS